MRHHPSGQIVDEGDTDNRIILPPGVRGRRLFRPGVGASHFGAAFLHGPLLCKGFFQFGGRFDGRTVFRRRTGDASPGHGAHFRRWRRRGKLVHEVRNQLKAVFFEDGDTAGHFIPGRGIAGQPEPTHHAHQRDKNEERQPVVAAARLLIPFSRCVRSIAVRLAHASLPVRPRTRGVVMRPCGAAKRRSLRHGKRHAGHLMGGDYPISREL